MGPETMGRVRLGAAIALLALLLAGACLRPAPAAATIKTDILRILTKNGVAGSRTGVYVWNIDTGQQVYGRNSSTPLAPASNLKLLTSATALLDWGPDHRFVTGLYGPDGPSPNGTIHGDLYLRGYGDPSLSTLRYQRQVMHIKTSSFEGFVQKLRKLGVRKIKGDVIGDEGWFDTRRTGPDWKPGIQVECGPLSALSGNEGLDDGNRIPDPAKWSAKLLLKALQAAGIKVTGKAGTGTVPVADTLLATQRSAPLSTILKRMNKDSDNFFAEMLLKGLGKDFTGAGTSDAGVGVVRVTLKMIGLPLGWVVMHDGSGLSYDDRVTASFLVQLLTTMTRRPEAGAYYQSLAIAGEDGTLRERMRGTAAQGNAHAKTGTLDIAVSLSGYLLSANRRSVGYSVLVNGSDVDWTRATKAQDAITVLLAGASLPGTPLQSPAALAWHHQLLASQAVDASGGVLQPQL
ncbi:MAG TPA: D-alanyl-D-alanine carboxypeptidase/D-alanyl-D-alanine-endopeptidase [Thermoleophilia bacterium]|nr:D-alanyl-D-alanine carboxypeptidase/D-alanyl-D-alanine-endopeptidase [Thermoleophilia bacterium]